MELDSDSIAALAADIRHGLSGARLHGALVGGLCGDVAGAAGWQPVLEAALGEAPGGESLPEFHQLLALTEASLADPDFAFTPLLPDADERLAPRVEGLADWCDAFVLAFAAAARGPGRAAITDESGELLADLTAIAGGLDPAAMDDSGEEDEDEEDFMQILEFVRIAALSLYADRPGAAALH